MATEAAASYIDTLLKRVAARGAKLGIRFESGAPVRVLDGNGGLRDVTNRALSPQEIMAAIGPIVPDAIKRLPQTPSVNFNYDCAGVGVFNVALRRDGEKISVSIDPGDAAAPADLGRSAPQATKSEPEFVVETTSVGAVIAANGPAAAGFVESIGAREKPAATAPIAPVAPVARIAPVAPLAPVTPLAPTTSPAIDRLFRLMCDAKASDLHLSVGMKPLVRKDGEIKVLDESAPAFDPESMSAMLEPIMPERNREEFGRRHDTDFAYEIAGLGRFRSNIFMDRKGPGAVFRVIPSKILTAEDLGLSPHILKLCQLNKGLVLVTGPTGSGKSTTLCAMVDYINRTRRDHIITIEDPIEFVHENKQCLMNQREVHVHTDGFKDALRAALREDPDIVLVGEMRDLETVAIAIETAETGHLVFGTLHTTTAASTVDRVIDQFPTDRQAQIRIMLSESLKGVIAQTLCKKIGGGRAAALEVLIVTSAVSNLIREAKTFQIPSIMQVGKSVGMVSLNDALMDLVAKKLVAPEEAYSKSVDKGGFEALLKRSGIDTKFTAAAAKEN
ncbi:MAG TPA: PilT/PilU family type 4a pilus ATPase [Vicinamibacterales bacterium]|nr:PilT/PilU family type 4a pilus ATPase [Vicinamibacterales bacterium]